MDKIIVTGCNGQLGRAINKELGATGKFEIVNTDVFEGEGIIPLDITNVDSVLKLVRDVKPKTIINCAAYTAVDKQESDIDLSYKINAIGPRNLSIASSEVGAKLVHVSTDYVFAGNADKPYTEFDATGPVSVYGKTKLAGEEFVKQFARNYFIIRTAWLYGDGKNFVKTMLNLTATKLQLKVVFDQVGTPTYAYDLAKVIYDIIENRKFEGNTGIYHYSNEGVTSWYDFTKLIAEIAGNKECDIQPCHSDEFPSPVKRPAFSVLDKTKVKETFGIKVPYWTDSLKICMKNLMKA